MKFSTIMSNEAAARLKINKLLEEAEWCLIGTVENPANIIVESI